MKKLTPKRKKFVQLYTDEKNKETFGNGTRSVMESYNTIKPEVAKVMANEILTSPNVIKAIERRTLKKEDIQHNLTVMTEKIERAISNDVTVENVPLIREYREYHNDQAKIAGMLQGNTVAIQVNIDRNKDLSSLSADELQQEVLKRMQANSSDGKE